MFNAHQEVVKYKMKLEEGEMICDKCNGTGTNLDQTFGDDLRHSWCNKCHGRRKVDWITNIIGETPCYYIKPGVYFKEIDLSEYVLSFRKRGKNET